MGSGSIHADSNVINLTRHLLIGLTKCPISGWVDLSK